MSNRKNKTPLLDSYYSRYKKIITYMEDDKSKSSEDVSLTTRSLKPDNDDIRLISRTFISRFIYTTLFKKRYNVNTGILEFFSEDDHKNIIMIEQIRSYFSGLFTLLHDVMEVETVDLIKLYLGMVYCNFYNHYNPDDGVLLKKKIMEEKNILLETSPNLKLLLEIFTSYKDSLHDSESDNERYIINNNVFNHLLSEYLGTSMVYCDNKDGYGIFPYSRYLNEIVMNNKYLQDLPGCVFDVSNDEVNHKQMASIIQTITTSKVIIIYGLLDDKVVENINNFPFRKNIRLLMSYENYYNSNGKSLPRAHKVDLFISKYCKNLLNGVLTPDVMLDGVIKPIQHRIKFYLKFTTENNYSNFIFTNRDNYLKDPFNLLFESVKRFILDIILEELTSVEGNSGYVCCYFNSGRLLLEKVLENYTNINLEEDIASIKAGIKEIFNIVLSNYHISEIISFIATLPPNLLKDLCYNGVDEIPINFHTFLKFICNLIIVATGEYSKNSPWNFNLNWNTLFSILKRELKVKFKNKKEVYSFLIKDNTSSKKKSTPSTTSLKEDTPNKNKNVLSIDYNLDYINCDYNLDFIVNKTKELNIQPIIVLYGQSGAGKTEFANQFAKLLKKKVYNITTGDYLKRYVGEGENNVSKIFSQAREDNGVIIVDEADNLTTNREDTNKNKNDMTNHIIMELDKGPVILFLTTNFLDSIDKAILRRINLKIEFKDLTLDNKVKIFKEVASKANIKLNKKSHNDTLSILKRIPLTVGIFKSILSRLIFTPNPTEELFLEALEEESKLVMKNNTRTGFL